MREGIKQMKSVIENCTGLRVKFRERLLRVRGQNGCEFDVPFSEIDETSDVQDLGDSGSLVTRRTWAEIAGIVPPQPEPAPAENEAAQDETTMAYDQKDMSGGLFKQDKKGNEKAPDYSGTCMIGDRLYYISAWLKTAQSGTKYMSLSFKLKDQQRQGSSTARDRDDDIKF
jgi:hypothetical protein